MSRGRAHACSTWLGGGRAHGEAATEPLLGDGDVPGAVVQSRSWEDSQWEVRSPKRVLLRGVSNFKKQNIIIRSAIHGHCKATLERAGEEKDLISHPLNLRFLVCLSTLFKYVCSQHLFPVLIFMYFARNRIVLH